jgi:hypothetical protein
VLGVPARNSDNMKRFKRRTYGFSAVHLIVHNLCCSATQSCLKAGGGDFRLWNRAALKPKRRVVVLVGVIISFATINTASSHLRTFTYLSRLDIPVCQLLAALLARLLSVQPETTTCPQSRAATAASDHHNGSRYERLEIIRPKHSAVCYQAC